ncbi:DinB family protein [Thalassobacillus hwangdonensis]|uniref:DinB family protein n=1 Tax=Thalassobacillus hwangdonensis TaxID=546108 RepID=A0ABW3L284_9BACI
MEKQLLSQLEFSRKRTITALKATTEAQADVIPEGFNNSIRWNLGHILLATENMLFSFLNEKGSLPGNYTVLFNGGTSPSAWAETEIPPLPELDTKLDEQLSRITEELAPRLSEKGPEPFQLGPEFKMEKLEDVLLFAIWHEGLHQGTITALKQAQGITDLWTKV